MKTRLRIDIGIDHANIYVGEGVCYPSYTNTIKVRCESPDFDTVFNTLVTTLREAMHNEARDANSDQ
jgi:hypothetical protein